MTRAAPSRTTAAPPDAAAHTLEGGAAAQSDRPHRHTIVQLLNDALASELICVLRGRHHHGTADGIRSVPIQQEFLAAAPAAEGKDWLH